MTEEFRSDRSFSMAESASEVEPPASDLRSDREPVRLMIVSSRRGVVNMIHTLHLKGIASADEWSALQPEPMTGKWMSIVTKYI